MAEKPIYTIDGASFGNFAEFIEECNRGFIRAFGGEWSGNLDAFNDYFNWGDGDYVLVWKNSAKSRTDLGHQAMAAWFTAKIEMNRPRFWTEGEMRLKQALEGTGPTLFDWLVEIVREQPNVELRLE